MEHLTIPQGYTSPLTIRETEVAIKEIKDHFERSLAKSLHLTRVSAPLFVKPESGLNDNLNGVERPVSFGSKNKKIPPQRLCTPWQNGNVMHSNITDFIPEKDSIPI